MQHLDGIATPGGIVRGVGRLSVRRARVRGSVMLALVALATCAPAAAAATTAKGTPTATGAASISNTGTTTAGAISVPQSLSNPLAPGVPLTSATVSTTTPTVSVSTSSSSSGGISGSDAALIAIGAIVVLVGVSFYIWRDARRHAPVKAGADPASLDGGRRATKATPKQRKLSPAERKRRKRGRAR